jgi:hypothetical protein
MFQKTAEHDLALARIVTLREAAQLAGLSEDTLKRRHPEKIIRLSVRRVGMRVRDPLFLTDENNAT